MEVVVVAGEAGVFQARVDAPVGLVRRWRRSEPRSSSVTSPARPARRHPADGGGGTVPVEVDNTTTGARGQGGGARRAGTNPNPTARPGEPRDPIIKTCVTPTTNDKRDRPVVVAARRSAPLESRAPAPVGAARVERCQLTRKVGVVRLPRPHEAFMASSLDSHWRAPRARVSGQGGSDEL